MKIKIITPDRIKQAEGLIVAIDVLRAFTTACFILAQKAKKVIIASSIEEALIIKKNDPLKVLIGERHGIMPSNFDFGNSPTEISRTNLQGKTVIFTTSKGTKILYTGSTKGEVLISSFVNSKATVNYIKKTQPKSLTLVPTDTRYRGNEDEMYAFYLTKKLRKQRVSFIKIRKKIIDHPNSYGFLKKPLTKYAKHDFYLAMSLNRFDFAIKTIRDKSGRLCLKKEDSLQH